MQHDTATERSLQRYAAHFAKCAEIGSVGIHARLHPSPLPEERPPRTSARLAPLNRIAANVGRASRLPSLRVRANEVVPTGAGERDRLKTLSSEGRVTRVPDFYCDFRAIGDSCNSSLRGFETVSPVRAQGRKRESER